MIAYLLLLFNNPCGRLLSHRDLVYPFVTLLLFTGGYTLFHIEARYLWIANILLLLMGGKVLYILFKTEFFRKKIVRNVFMLVFMLSFMITPIKSSVGIGNENMNKEMFLLSEELKVKYDIKGNIASNRLKLQTGTHDSWHKTLRLSYWLGSRYFGQPRENIDDKDLENELEKFDIDYFFYWEDRSDIPVFLHKHRDITKGTMSGLKIYALKE